MKCRIVQSTDETGTPSTREEIQWPALENLKPGNLKRTVSTIMKEWEKSLTPPPPERKDPLSKSLVKNAAAETPSKSSRPRENTSTHEDAVRTLSR